MAAPNLDDALLEALRSRADPAEYDRVLRGVTWKNGGLAPGRYLKAGKPGPETKTRMLRLLADAPAGSTLAPPLRANAPTLAILGGSQLDLACVRGLAPLRKLGLLDASLVFGLDELTALPALAELEIDAVRALREGERLTSTSLRTLRAIQSNRSNTRALRLLPHLGQLPALEMLSTRVEALDDLSMLGAASPRLSNLTMSGHLPDELGPLGQLPLGYLALTSTALEPALARVPALPQLRSLLLVTSEPNADVNPAPFVLSLDETRFPTLRRCTVHATTAAITALSSSVEELELGYVAPGFSVTLEQPTMLEKLSFKSKGVPLKLDFLRWFPALEELSIEGPGIASLDGLSWCPRLKKLDLYRFTSATDASYLRAHPVPELVTGDREALGLPPRSA